MSTKHLQSAVYLHSHAPDVQSFLFPVLLLVFLPRVSTPASASPTPGKWGLCHGLSVCSQGVQEGPTGKRDAGFWRSSGLAGPGLKFWGLLDKEVL